ncbi:hypothetical protein GH714_039011 [Hevea brasiliensis]|uniref:6-phosphogluconate dehydrogenase NADP-binding domain-containing protein n=1 Tax=Hevea brasiliensis TaxID=3981 RepID=A0A6A6KAN8_HEVBR|nr:hypothetical protein GH714_039011 [Hevea brasiliensis]
MGLPGQSQPQPQLVQETASTSGSESGSWFGGWFGGGKKEPAASSGFWKLRLDAACGSPLGSNILRTWVFGNMEKRQAVEVRFPSETGPASCRHGGPPRSIPSRRRLQFRCRLLHCRVSSDVRHVLLDPTTGALQGLRPGGVLVDMTTSDPSLASEISAAASAKNCHSIDAPVSGGDRGAKNGTLAIFAGGDEGVIHRLNPLFALMGKVNYMGAPGKGQFAKLANQITIASTMVGLVEGIVYAYKAGLNVELYLNAISAGAAGSKSLDFHGARILKRDFEAGFYVNHFVKDLGICLKECQNMGLALPGLALAQQLYLSLKAHGEGNLGTQALILALERLNNVCLENLASQNTAA